MAETMQRWSMNALGRENLKLTQNLFRSRP